MARRFLGGVFLALAAISPVPAQTGEDVIQRSFAGDRVHLDLSAGKYRVTASRDDRIRVVTWKGDNVSVRLDVNLFGTRADLKVNGPAQGFEARIELPKRVDIVTSLGGGALQMDSIEGSKDIDAKAADIEVNVGDRNHYKRVNASVQTGALSTDAFDAVAVSKRGDGYIFHWEGPGGHDIQIQLNSGRLTLK